MAMDWVRMEASANAFDEGGWSDWGDLHILSTYMGQEGGLDTYHGTLLGNACRIIDDGGMRVGPNGHAQRGGNGYRQGVFGTTGFGLALDTAKATSADMMTVHVGELGLCGGPPPRRRGKQEEKRYSGLATPVMVDLCAFDTVKYKARQGRVVGSNMGYELGDVVSRDICPVKGIHLDVRHVRNEWMMHSVP